MFRKIHVAFPIHVTGEYFKKIFQTAKIWNPLDSRSTLAFSCGLFRLGLEVESEG